MAVVLGLSMAGIISILCFVVAAVFLYIAIGFATSSVTALPDEILIRYRFRNRRVGKARIRSWAGGRIAQSRLATVTITTTDGHTMGVALLQRLPSARSRRPF